MTTLIKVVSAKNKLILLLKDYQEVQTQKEGIYLRKEGMEVKT
jgi:hypothetical protein